MNCRKIASALSRLGKEVVIRERSVEETNAFNNPESGWDTERRALCVRTYPSNNSQVTSRGGPYDQDNPLFIFERGEEPRSGDRIVYDGVTYGAKAPTKYESHVEIAGEPVSE